MAKVLVIASDWQALMLWPGGIAAYIDSLIRGFVSLGDTVRLLAVVRPNEKERMRFWEAHEPRVIVFPIAPDKKPTNWPGRKIVSTLEILRCVNPYARRFLEGKSVFARSVDSIKRLTRLLSAEKPDLVIVGHLDVGLYPLALCLLEQKLPYVVIAHDSEICRLPGCGRNDIVLRRTMLGGASWIAANSRHTKSLMEMWKIPTDRVKIIYPPISQDTISESADLDSGDKNDKHRLNLVTICRLVRGKGIDLVIEALRILDTRQIPYRYVIGGDGPERESLAAMVDAFGLCDKVHFMGSVEGQVKWNLLRRGDVFITPSRTEPMIPWQEGFGIAFVEAAAFGLPSVGSRSGGIPDAVIDGETGILVAEESYVDLADALTFLYEEPEIRKRMGKAARERAREQFSPAAVANRFREENSNTLNH